MKAIYQLTAIPMILLFSAIGCSSNEEKSDNVGTATPATSSVSAAKTTLEPKSGNRSVKGQIQFTNSPSGVQVVAEIEGLKPNSTHGFHIHETGDCSAIDASSAGGHFNPDKSHHASPTDAEYHAGDMGNVTADKTGRVHFERLFPKMSLNPSSPSNIVGKAVVLHGKKDDLKSQPAGESGPRIGCGVIVE